MYYDKIFLIKSDIELLATLSRSLAKISPIYKDMLITATNPNVAYKHAAVGVPYIVISGHRFMSVDIHQNLPGVARHFKELSSDTVVIGYSAYYRPNGEDNTSSTIDAFMSVDGILVGQKTKMHGLITGLGLKPEALPLFLFLLQNFSNKSKEEVIASISYPVI